jgi:hypothetical protein
MQSRISGRNAIFPVWNKANVHFSFTRPILIAALILSSASAVNGQRLVIPNKPYSFLGSAPGYITINEGTVGIDFKGTSGGAAKSFIGLHTIHGYQVNRNFIIAAGTGVSVYSEGAMVPVFIDLRFNFAIHTLTPYILGEGGMLINTSGNTALFINPGAGIRYAPTRKLAFNLGTGALIQVAGTQDIYLSFMFGLVFRPSRKYQ